MSYVPPWERHSAAIWRCAVSRTGSGACGSLAASWTFLVLRNESGFMPMASATFVQGLVVATRPLWQCCHRGSGLPRQHPPPRLFREYPREAVGFAHDLTRRLVALAVALDQDALGFQRVGDFAHDERHAVERQRVRRRRGCGGRSVGRSTRGGST